MVKKLILKLILIIIIAVIPLVAYNVILDPYMVLRKDYANMFIVPNERYIKTDFILNNPAKYDSFLFGSSRVSQVPTEMISKATGNRFYNMTYASGIVSEHLGILKLFVKRKVTIRNVVIGLDYFSFTAMPPETQMRSIMYPETLVDTVKIYFSYLTLPFDSSMFKEIKFDGKEAVYDITGSGEYRFIKREKLISLNPRKHEEKFAKPALVICTNRLERTLKELQEVIDLCRKNNINLTFFINPNHAKMYLCDDKGFLRKVRTGLVQITDFWDFSGPSSVTMNNFNYVDPIHFRRNVGEYMIGRMFNVKNKIPPDFGTFVTKSSIDNYVQKTEGDFDRYKKQINPNCMSCPKKAQ